MKFSLTELSMPPSLPRHSFVLTYFECGIIENKKAFICTSIMLFQGKNPEGFMLNAVPAVPCKLQLL